ncbi:MAG: hypothetical protein JJV98_04895 [Desulfosarcina sp.]|nr:hypothetical protein [Desulfobacterales bacterium]
MKNPNKLAKFLHYILGRRPDEFGLVPDEQGYVAVKDLIKVLHEEKWHHVRPGHLETLPYCRPNAGIEMDQHRIRACERGNLPAFSDSTPPPKLLYSCIRRKAYLTVSRHGLVPQTHPDKVVLYADMALAQRVGRRRDATPIVVTVQTTVAQRAGILFMRFGQSIYLAASIPVNCCRLPTPPKPTRSERREKEVAPAKPPQPAGSYTVDWDRLENGGHLPKSTGKKSKQWRRERLRLRRMKQSPKDSS